MRDPRLPIILPKVIPVPTPAPTEAPTKKSAGVKYELVLDSGVSVGESFG